jgi:hypothetical protein
MAQQQTQTTGTALASDDQGRGPFAMGATSALAPAVEVLIQRGQDLADQIDSLQARSGGGAIMSDFERDQRCRRAARILASVNSAIEVLRSPVAAAWVLGKQPTKARGKRGGRQ